MARTLVCRSQWHGCRGVMPHGIDAPISCLGRASRADQISRSAGRAAASPASAAGDGCGTHSGQRRVVQHPAMPEDGSQRSHRNLPCEACNVVGKLERRRNSHA